MNDLAQPATLVIFGITGDLGMRKLLPALYHLQRQNLLPVPFKIVGVSRQSITTQALMEKVAASLQQQSSQPPDADTLKALTGMIEMVHMDLLQTAEYQRLRQRLDAIETEAGVCMNRLYYLAIPAQTYEPVVRELGRGGLNHSCPHGTGAARLLIEKPFGYDLASAHDLVDELGQQFHEEQIYRIDHYLAKETAQNILAFRFQNPLFLRVWNHESISHILISATEAIDIEGRTTFYEQTGALRDFVQSHLLQLLALTTMDKPAQLTSDAIHRQKLALLQAIRPIPPDRVGTDAVRGQYAGYRQDVQNPASLTETFAALRLEIDSERWRGVPVLLRTGKALQDKAVEIIVVFTDGPDSAPANKLTIRIQPNEGIVLELLAKKPGLTDQVEPVHMEFCYHRSFKNADGHPDAYERVLTDAFRGDKTLFATSDEVLASWRILENVIHEWAKNDDGLAEYPRGSWGPDASQTLANQAGIAWPTATLAICE